MTRARVNPTSQPRRRLHRAAARVLALLAILLILRVVAARDAGAATLTGISVADSKPGETRLLLSFNSILPQFSIATDDNDAPVLGFGGAVRANGASVPPGDHGLLKTVEFNRRGAVLILEFVGSAPIHVAAAPIAGRALEISITAAPRTNSH